MYIAGRSFRRLNLAAFSFFLFLSLFFLSLFLKDEQKAWKKNANKIVLECMELRKSFLL